VWPAHQEEANGIPVVDRFRYHYDTDEPGEWVPRVRQAAGSVKTLHQLMNNRDANYGTTNARDIAALLTPSRLGPVLASKRSKGVGSLQAVQATCLGHRLIRRPRFDFCGEGAQGIQKLPPPPFDLAP
jgi:hypothetical protein